MTTVLLGHSPTALLRCVRFQQESRASILKVLLSAFFTEASLSIPRGDHSLPFALVSTIICVVWCEFLW